MTQTPPVHQPFITVTSYVSMCDIMNKWLTDRWCLVHKTMSEPSLYHQRDVCSFLLAITKYGMESCVHMCSTRLQSRCANFCIVLQVGRELLLFAHRIVLAFPLQVSGVEAACVLTHLWCLVLTIQVTQNTPHFVSS